MSNPQFTEMQIALQKQYVNKSFVRKRQEPKPGIKYRTNTSSSFHRMHWLKVTLNNKETWDGRQPEQTLALHKTVYY